MKTNKHAYMNQDHKVSLEGFTKEDIKIAYNMIRKVFQEKKESSWQDIVIYNIIRQKPVFKGVEKITQDKYFNYKYNKYLQFSVVFQEIMKNEKPSKELVNYILSEIEQSFNNNVKY